MKIGSGGIFRVSSWLLPTIQIIVFTLNWKKPGKAKGDVCHLYLIYIQIVTYLRSVVYKIALLLLESCFSLE